MKAIQIEKPEVLKIIDMDKPALTQQDNVIVKMKVIHLHTIALF